MTLTVRDAMRIRRSREKRFRRVLTHLRPRTVAIIRDYVRALHEELWATKQELRAATTHEGKDQ